MVPNLLTKVPLYRMAGAQSPKIEPAFPMAASQVIKKGDLLTLSSGNAAQMLALPGSNYGVTLSGGNDTCFGMALADMTSAGVAAVEKLPVLILNDATEILLRIYKDGAVTSAGVVAAVATDTQQQDLTTGTAYQVGRFRGASANEWQYVFSVVTTNGEFILAAKSEQTAADEYFGMVWAKLRQASRELG